MIMRFQRRVSAFTLIELLISITVFLILITIGVTIFIELYKIKGGLEARQKVTTDTYFLVENLQRMVKDYTIDYEEYWNRRQIGCYQDQADSIKGYCTHDTGQGNESNVWTRQNLLNSTSLNPYRNSQQFIYQCSSVSSVNSSDPQGYIIHVLNNCAQSGKQAYGQYAALFRDRNSDVDTVEGVVGDDDDRDLGDFQGDLTQAHINNIPELYLISHDGKRRLWLRRKCGDFTDLNTNNQNEAVEQHCTLQILKLKGLDLGIEHGLQQQGSTNTSSLIGMYDGKIDTWVCDRDEGFDCKGISNYQFVEPYQDYHMPAGVDDGWRDLLGNDLTVTKWNLYIAPHHDPSLAWKNSNVQRSPFVVLAFQTQLYAKNWLHKLPIEQMEAYALPIQTMFVFQH